MGIVETGGSRDAVVGVPAVAPATGAATLVLEGIAKSWAPAGPTVLAATDMLLEAGTTAVVSGPNGAGKTTLLRIAAGLILPDGGTVRICGRDPERERTWCQRRTGFLSAGNSGLYGRLKAEHHLELWSRLTLISKNERPKAIGRVLEAFALEPICGRRVDRLSMGQRQRLRLALAFLHEPVLVLLDEPLTSLDEDGVALLQRALDELRARGGSAVVCAPSGRDQVLSLDRAWALERGRLVAQ